MHDLPRQLSVQELSELFEGETALVRRLAAEDDPLAAAAAVARSLPDREKVEALLAHPAIGAPTLSARSAAEQGTGDDRAVLDELEALNKAYEQKFGFRLVVFVDGRSKRELLPVLRRRIGRTRAEELETGLDELVEIARARWRAR